MSHCDVYHMLCYISDIHEGLSMGLFHIVTLSMGYMSNMKKGYVPLRIKKWYIQ